MRANKPLLHGDITASIIDSFFEVHKELGFGFREYIYTRGLERLLIAKGHNVEREVAVMGRPRPSFCQKSALLSRLLRKSVQATKPAVPVVAVAVPFYESECQERTSSRQSAQQKLLWHSALNLDGARQSGPNAGVGSTTSFLA